MPERSLKRAPREEAINSVLVKDINSVLEERLSSLLDYAVKRIEKQAEVL